MNDMIDRIITFFGDTISYGGEFLISWCTNMIPSIFLVLILTNTIVRLIPSRWIEKAASGASRHVLLKYMLIPFLGSIVLTNPSALTLGRFMSEKDKPSYYASASFFCHTSNGIFPHINSSELFIWLGIAHGVEMLGYSSVPLAIRYLAAGLVANFICGIVTDRTTAYYCRKMNITLSDVPDWKLNVQPAYGKRSTAEKQTEAKGQTAGMKTENDNGKAVLKMAGETRWRPVCIRAGNGGYGGPLILKPDEKHNKLIYVAGGGRKPAIVDKIEEITGCTSVNGFKAGIPDEEIFLAVIDCGGTLRCGIYPKKRIPTVNILPTGKSGPLAQYITEDIYVSAVTEDCISEVKTENMEKMERDTEGTEMNMEETETSIEGSFPGSVLLQRATGVISAWGRGCTCAYKAARDSVDIVLHTLLPLMGFISLFTAVIECSGLNSFIADHLTFLSSNIIGLFLLGIIISFPLISPILSPGAIIAQVIGTVIGAQIGNG
ncbi:MAG: glucitol/sorbitol-specific PTS transporter subunit IIC, partial [Lachnospiraceae bacterium]